MHRIRGLVSFIAGGDIPWKRFAPKRSKMSAVSTKSRVLPHSADAEASVLGGILLRNDMLALLDRLEVEHFYDPKHQAVFAAMRALESATKPIDEVTLEAQLQQQGRLEAVGGLVFLSGLALKVPTADNVVHYAKIVEDLHAARVLMMTASEIAARGYEDYGDIEEYLDDAESKIFEVTQRQQKGGAEHLRGLLKQVFSSLDERFKAAGGITGVPSGFTGLDERTAGFQPGELTILAARPAMGKTSFALSIARNAAATSGFPILCFSLEMSADQLAERMLCSEAAVDSTALRRGQLQRQDLTNLTYAADTLSKAPIMIDDTPALTLRDLRASARRFMADKNLRGEKPFGLIIIDYLQLMQGSRGKSNQNREQEISEISRGLKILSKEVSCPIIALSQLNRSLESRPDKRPQLADLRESGAIEQDADLILFIYRDVVYNKETEHPNVAEVIIGKNRHGAMGTVESHFEGRFTRFSNLSKRDEY